MTLTCLSSSLVPSSDQGLWAYIKRINLYPSLTQEQEHGLANKVKYEQDVDAARQLIVSHLKLVVKVAYSMRGYGIALMDLISEGNIGLMHAVKKFEPEKGFRFSTYAVWWVKAAMQEFILKSWSLVKVGTTVAQKKLFFGLNKLKKKIRSLSPATASWKALDDQEAGQIATNLGVTKSEVLEMDSRLSLPDASLDAKIDYSDENSYAIIDHLADPAQSHDVLIAESETEERKKALLKSAIDNLNPRDKDIFISRNLLDQSATLDDLSKKYGISKERVRQLEVRALATIKSFCALSAV